MRYTKGRRGFALVLTLLVLPLLAMLAFTLTSLGVKDLNVSRVREDSRVAMYCAEAGAEDGLQRLKDDTSYSGNFQRTMSNVTVAANVTIFNNGGGSAAIQAPSGAVVPAGFGYILSECTMQGGRVKRSFGMLARLTGSAPSPWNYAAFGYESIDLTGNAFTDSFTSANGGTYNATKIGFGHAEAFTKGGHIGTNGIQSGDINFSGGNAQVGGRIDIGRNGVASTVVSGSAGTNYGSGDDAVLTLSSSVARPPVTIPALPNGTFTTSGVLPSGYRYGNIQVSGGNQITLGSGVYVFDGLKLSGQSKLVLAPGASAEVYITGNNNGVLDLSGQGIANSSGIAKNLTLYGGPGLSSEISVTGNASAYYRVYAPSSPIKIAGNGDIYGSIVGRTIRNVGNGKIHYDRDLSSAAVPPDATVIYRQRF
ncbi:hypothetical protein IV102_22435 [bacterium]|nr:hypothetical protein [bacterium]